MRMALSEEERIARNQCVCVCVCVCVCGIAPFFRIRMGAPGAPPETPVVVTSADRWHTDATSRAPTSFRAHERVRRANLLTRF